MSDDDEQPEREPVPRGTMHRAGETIQVCGTVKRASFDTTELLRVKFIDGSEALLFEDELGQEIRAGDLPPGKG
jgi:hypothetical protein